VYVVAEDGMLELRPVEVGPKIDKLQIIESGLQAGERVALEVMRLRPGIKVLPVLAQLDESGAVLEAPGQAETESETESAPESAPESESGA
jgi:hypothetical protein